MSRERERGTSLRDIRSDHVARYAWAGAVLEYARLSCWEVPATRRPRILDCFCGNGYGCYMLASLHLDAQILGVDKAEEAIAEGEWHFDAVGVELKCVRVDPALKSTWPRSDRPWDAIVSFESLEHVEDDQAFVRMLRELIHPEHGVLLISCPNETVLPYSTLNWPFHYRHYTEPEIRKLLSEAGFNCSLAGQRGDTITFTPPIITGPMLHHVAFCTPIRPVARCNTEEE